MEERLRTIIREWYLMENVSQGYAPSKEDKLISMIMNVIDPPVSQEEGDELLDSLKRSGKRLAEAFHVTQEDIDSACKWAREVCWDEKKFEEAQNEMKSFYGSMVDGLLESIRLKDGAKK